MRAMATHPEYPGASSFKDRHGKIRWRYRIGKKTYPLSGEPGDPSFIAAFEAALVGERPKAAEISAMPGATLPKSFGAAWRKVRESADWQELDPATHAKNIAMAEAFLAARVNPDAGEKDSLVWRDVPVEDMRRRHVKMVLSHFAQTPHKARHILVALRKMILAALDEEWIESDPTWRIKWRPKTKGWRPWTDQELEKFEAFHRPGSVARAVYAAALWAGKRRGDVASLKRSERTIRRMRIDGEFVDVECFVTIMEKGDEELAIPVTPPLAEALDALPNHGDRYFAKADGSPRSEKSMTGDMAKWTAQAGLPKGLTIHGLRKTLGKLAAEASATPREGMDLLGHKTLQQNELYSRGADQLRMAKQAIDKVIDMRAANRVANRKG